MAGNKAERKQRSERVAETFCAIPWLLPLIVYVLICLIGLAFYALFMLLSLWTVSCLRGRYVLFVHSNSPIWQEYIERNILPRLPRDTVILNWSERSKWKRFSFPVRVFRFYGGRREFNPMGLVCKPFRLVRTFRFWKPFRDFKHGEIESVTDTENKFFQYLRSSKIDDHRAMGSTGRF